MITGRYLHGRLLPSIQEPAGNRRISVDSPVAQKRPVAADVFESFQIHVAYKDFFPVVRGFSDDAAKGIAEERRAPEFESRSETASCGGCLRELSNSRRLQGFLPGRARLQR